MEYEIEKVLNSRRRRSGLQYLVRWKGYGPEEDEWLHEGYMGNAKKLVKRFHSENPEADK
jgi:hypothetical protein